MKKILIWYLKRIIRQLDFEEESLEINQDLIRNANEIWQHTRKTKINIKDTVSFLEM